MRDVKRKAESVHRKISHIVHLYAARCTLYAIGFLLVSCLHADVNLHGYVETYNRYWVNPDSGRWTWNENRLQIQLEGAPSENLHFYTELRLRGFGFPGVSQISDLQVKEKNRVYPWSLELREAYADIYGFIHPDLDLRIGRQVIAWGTADKLNPTSNLLPYDLEDFFEFGEKLGVNALKLTFTHESWTFEADFIPVFTPATLPPPEWSIAMFKRSLELPQGLNLVSLEDTLLLPERKIDETSEIGFKISTTLLDWDLSLSYFRGFDGLPLTQKVEIIPVDTLGDVNVKVISSYPKMQVIGADFAGSLGDFGFWGEGALFIPEDFIMKKIVPTAFGPVEMQDTLLSKDEPYFKFVLGTDYTFKNGLYLNAQYVRGFLHERGKDSLNDYLVMRLEKKFFNDELKLAPLSFAASITDWDEPKENYGFAWIPELSYSPVDNIELRLGAFVLDGKGDGLFARLKERDEVYLRVKLSF